MKIAILADRLVMGGLETHIITVINELLRCGHKILLNTAFFDPGLQDQVRDEQHGFIATPWSEPPVEAIASFEPDVVHAHPFTAIFRGSEIARNLEKPFFVTMHGLYDFGLDRSASGNSVCEQVKAVIAVDQRVADLLSGAIAYPQKIIIIPNGIDCKHFTPLALDRIRRAEYGLVPDWPTLMVISRMADGKEKPVFQLMDCAPVLAERIRGLNIFLIGSGACHTALLQRIETLKGQVRLRIYAAGQQNDVASWIGMADLVLACDRAAMEAMACQRAVLAMNAEGFAALIDRSNYHSILMNRRGYRQLSDSELIRMLIGLCRDRPYRTRLARDGVGIIHTHFNSQSVVLALEALYRQWVV